MASRGGDVSTSAAGKGKKSVWPREAIERADVQKSIEQLNVWEFRKHFHVLLGISIRLLGGDLVSTEQEPLNDIVLSKEQFNVGLCFLLPSLFKQFLHFTKIPPTFLHPNVVRILMGYSILNMLYHLDLSLLEVLFIYTIKMSGKEIFSLFAHIPSLQLVTGLLDSTKGATKGCVVVLGP